MAKFFLELPLEVIKCIDDIDNNAEKMVDEMLEGGAQAVYDEVDKSLKKSFKTTRSLRKGLKITKVYRHKSDDSVNIKVGFYGYDPDKKSDKYPKGVPIPLIALAREYGTSSGEQKKPFFRRSFKKAKIEEAMQKVQDKYIKGD